MSKGGSVQFIFRKHMSIGAMAAEEDRDFLASCFVDTGDYDLLSDVNSSRCIVLGRVGAGKSALIQKIKAEEENVIEIDPENLSLNYILNSNVLDFFESIGVKLDTFYKLLWMHLFCVELIKRKYKISNEAQERNFFNSISSILVKDKRKEKAIEYLKNWGNKFWLDTEVRVKEIATKFEDQLSSSVDGSVLGIPLSAGAASTLTKEVKEELRIRGQSVVNSVQIADLNQVISLLADDVFSDSQQSYYIVIDKLDDNWIDDETRCRLIRALLEATKTFRKIETLKVIIALRVDLLSRVFDKTRDAGFQEEKYDDLLLKVRWSRSDLEKLIDKRVSYLIRSKYSGNGAKFGDVFAPHVGSSRSIDFIIDRTLMRPRDVIQYVNECLEQAQGQAQVTAKNIRDAEISYSKKRIASLCHEWHADYPCLEMCFDLLKRRRDGFKHSDIQRDQVENLALELSTSENSSSDPLAFLAKRLYEGDGVTWSNFLNATLRVLYKVGALGVKRDGFSGVIWSQENEPDLSEGEVKRSSHFYVHPMLWRVLGVHDDAKRS